MKAVVQDRYGAPDVLQVRDIPTPEVGEGRVLVRVGASSVNPLDWHFMRGEPWLMRLAGSGIRRPRRTIQGADVAGTVEAVGPGVTRLQPGDEVFGWCHGGGFAEFVSVPAGNLLPRPAHVTVEEAGGVGVAAFTALQAVRDHGAVGQGTRVLIVGASGGVGTFAVQLAVARGAHVTGVCSGRNVELVASLGAHQVVDYTRDDVAASDERWDVVLQIAGDRRFGDLRRVMTQDGVLVWVGGDGDGKLLGPVPGMASSVLRGRFASQSVRAFTASETTADLQSLADMLAAGTLRTAIDRTYPLVDVAAAIAYLEQGHARGKVIVTV